MDNTNKETNVTRHEHFETLPSYIRKISNRLLFLFTIVSGLVLAVFILIISVSLSKNSVTSMKQLIMLGSTVLIEGICGFFFAKYFQIFKYSIVLSEQTRVEILLERAVEKICATNLSENAKVKLIEKLYLKQVDSCNIEKMLSTENSNKNNSKNVIKNIPSE